MLNVLTFLKNFVALPLRRDDRGVTSVEYGMLLVLIVVVVGVGAALLGTNLGTFFTNFAGKF